MQLRLSALLSGVALVLGACANVQAAPAANPGSTAQAYGSYLAARAAASDHDMSAAARLFRQTLADDPDNSAVLGQALLYTAGAGNVDEAASLARQAVQTTPDDRIARLTLAVAAVKAHDFREARDQIARSGKGPFTSLTLSLLDAWALEGLGDTEAALTDLKAVPSEGGTAALETYHRALILDLEKRNADADTAYRAALAAAPTSPRVIDAYGRFLERTGRVAEARSLYGQHADDVALDPVVQAGKARLEAGKIPERLIPNAQAGAAEALFGIAASLGDDSSADVAILYLRLALYLAPDLDLAKIVLADRNEALKKYEEAIAVYESIGPDSSYRFAAEVQAAIDKGRLEQNEKAIADLQRLTAQKPSDITAWTALGDIYRSTKKYGQAADAYNHAIALLNPVTGKDWPLFYARGVVEERSHRWPEAERDLQYALKLSPDQPQVLNYLGYSWVDQGRNLPQAVAMLEKARALSPYDGYIIDSVGWAYFRLGRYQDAAKTLEQAVLQVPGDPTVNEHLGDAYWMIGRKLDAHFQWDHALAFGAEDAQKAEIEKKLQNGLTTPAGRSG